MPMGRAKQGISYDLVFPDLDHSIGFLEERPWVCALQEGVGG